MNYIKSERIISRDAVLRRTSLSDTSLWRRLKAGEFPAPVQLGRGSRIGWRESEVEAWIARLTTKPGAGRQAGLIPTPRNKKPGGPTPRLIR